MRELNSTLIRLAKRAEKLGADHIRDSFVEVGHTYTLLQCQEHHIMFGRRGTGKTHFLKFLQNDILLDSRIALYIDLRSLGSTGGIFSDQNIPLNQRATQLLVDILIGVHEQLSGYVWEADDPESSLIELLDLFIDQATNLQLVGTVEVNERRSNQYSQQTDAGLSLKTDGIGLSLTATDQNIQINELHERSSGLKRNRVHFLSITKILEKITALLPDKQLWVLLDEWSEVPLDLQPYVAEMLKRTFFPVNGITVKIAALEHRSCFRIFTPDTNVPVGLELGADAANVINLDEFMRFDNNQDTAKNFFKELLFRHVKATSKKIKLNDSNSFVEHAFSQSTVFDEFVISAEGIPRDAINILSQAAQSALDEKITIKLLRQGARKWFDHNKQSALSARPEALTLLEWIIREVIGKRHSRGFLLASDSKDELIDFLYDSRVLHVLGHGVSARNATGQRFTQYSLDYGCYVQLMASSKAPRGLIIESNIDNTTSHYVQIPKNDYRSVTSSILVLDTFYRNRGFDFYENTTDILLPQLPNKTAKLETAVPSHILDALPEKLGEIKIEGSQYVPLIFVGLVIRQSQGYQLSSGTEITKSLNEHVISKMNQKRLHSNNVSRALREKNISQLSWLGNKANGKSPKFYLLENWKDYWAQYFEKQPPSL